MQLIFDHRLIRHVIETSEKEHGRSSRVLQLAEKLLQRSFVKMPLWLFERIIGFLLALPIPVYSSVVYALVTNMRGLPHMWGMYIRGLYYREKLGLMEPNVFIDQGVFFAFPRGVELKEFSYIDKNVLVMSKTAKVGRRVHIAPRVFISGGGDFEIENYACIATNSNIITSTEVLKDGARCSGPMVSADQRKVFRGKVRIKKDAFIGANATLLPGVTIEPGTVVGAGVTVAKSSEPWGIYVGERAQRVGTRDSVLWPDN
ncbi:acyltransferase [Aromatoleum buckelii]|nr:acyltransferase [Aromatoleum buckelii]MCK0512722.1 acyltransferase [Aromatoleum buckelii]